MPIQFAGERIPGTVLAPGPSQGEPGLLIREIARWAVRGKEVIVSPVGDADLTVLLVLHNEYADHDALNADLKRLRRMAGISGDVDFQTPAIPHNIFGNCIFRGPRTLTGDDSGPVKDYAGTLDGGYWQIIQLTWLQLGVDGDEGYVKGVG